jgi:3-oxoacyl-[acyl-carrier-protein] synthase II
MRIALDEAEVGTVDAISTSGCSVPSDDHQELTAISKVFDKIPDLIALKSHVGHTGFASSNLESVLSLKAMQENQLPAIKNLSDPIEINDKPASMNFVTENKAKQINTLMQLNFGFQGFNAAIVFKKLD